MKTQKVALMEGSRVIGEIELQVQDGAEPIQIAATALEAVTAVKVNDETFEIDEIEEWWA